jgi:hypothetical protein
MSRNQQGRSVKEGSGMGSLARLCAVGAVTGLTASTLLVAPATADTSTVPAPSEKKRASSAPETRGDARTTGLRIKIKGVSAGARASVKVTGPKQRTKGKQYSKVIHRSKTLKVRPGKYKITSGILGATGGIDVPKKATKKVRVRKNKIKTRTMRYVFYAATPYVSFNANGGVGTMDPQISNVPAALNSNVFTRAGNNFAGWNTQLAGNGTAYADKATYPFAASTTLYAQWKVSCAAGGGAADTCTIGDTGPGGGKVFYVDENAATGSRYMEAAPNTWDGGSADPAIAWCNITSTPISGASGIAIGTGKTNTDNMVAACTSGAANSVRGYSSPGAPAGSWSLPSKDENNQLFIQRATVGGFAGGFLAYWSSSQINNVNAWAQSFEIDFASSRNKVTLNRVRPVKAF